MDSIVSLDFPDKPKHGGYRQGAGRKPCDIDQKYLAARGIRPALAGEILGSLVDERALWRRVLGSNDDRIVLDALKFLVSMRDGKPAQQINVTSQSISLNVDDLAKARAIVRELQSQVRTGEANASLEHDQPVSNKPVL
jgi:hypothetical protein